MLGPVTLWLLQSPSGGFSFVATVFFIQETPIGMGVIYPRVTPGAYQEVASFGSLTSVFTACELLDTL